MEITLPTNGCNISQSAGYIDNYYNGTRTRYLVNENKLTTVYRSTYSGNPTQYYNCLTTGDIIYKPELIVYFQVIAGVMIFLALAILWKIMLGKFFK